MRGGCAVVDPDLCIDCGECIRWCRHGAMHAATATPADLKRFKYTVALPSLTLYSQFGRDVEPGQVLQALRSLGFDDVYDLSAMCDMHASATDAYLSECRGPWPKISVTCPAIIHLIQLRYPDMIDNLLPIETARELAAKLLRRRLAAEKGLDPADIGIFFITPCSAMLQSIHHPEALEASYLDGAFSIAELYGPLLKAIKASGPVENPPPMSERGLLWAMAGGEIAGLRNANTITVAGVRDVLRVFDHIEEGKLQAVDFIEAYICPDGCISGQLTVENRYAARRTVQQIVRRHGRQAGEGAAVSEEKVRAMLREHFFDLEEHLKARPVRPLGRNLREAAERKREEERVLARAAVQGLRGVRRPELRRPRRGRGARPGRAGGLRLRPHRAPAGRRGPTTEPAMTKQMLVLELCCPQCGAALTEGTRVRLDGHVRRTHQHGQLSLSAVFGDYGGETDLTWRKATSSTSAARSARPASCCRSPARSAAPRWRRSTSPGAGTWSSARGAGAGPTRSAAPETSTT